MDGTTWNSDLNISSDGGGEFVNNEFKINLNPRESMIYPYPYIRV